MRRRGRIYFIGNRDTPLEQHLYVIGLEPARHAAPADRGRLVEQCDDGRGRDPRARHPLQSRPAVAGLSRRRGRPAPRLDRGEPARRHASLCAVRRRPRRADLRHDPRRRRHRSSITGCCRRRASRAGAIRSSSSVYGGPGTGRQATRAWGNPLQQYLVQHGWIVFSLDNRGSPDRGKAFENAIYHAMGDGRGRRTSSPASPGCAARIMSIRDRIAVYGWSYGGYMTLRLLEAAPGTFARRRRGRAGDPLGAVRHPLYRALSRQSRRPIPRPIRPPDALPNAGRIADPLLLLHGMADDNVVFENSTVLMARAAGAQPPVRDDGLSRRHPRRRRRGAPAPSLADDRGLPRTGRVRDAARKREPGVLEIPVFAGVDDDTQDIS